MNHTSFYHPPLLSMPDVPIPNHYGAYLQKRKHDVHTGIDLYADDGAEVYAVENGEVVIIKWFTGKEAGCPWWNDTMAVYVKGYTGVMCYGEVEPVEELKVGSKVYAGEHIANVKRVLKTDKGKATSMLHFALHRHGLDLQVKHNEDPESDDFYDLQMDPTLLLVQLKAKADMLEMQGKYENDMYELNMKIGDK